MSSHGGSGHSNAAAATLLLLSYPAATCSAKPPLSFTIMLLPSSSGQLLARALSSAAPALGASLSNVCRGWGPGWGSSHPSSSARSCSSSSHTASARAGAACGSQAELVDTLMRREGGLPNDRVASALRAVDRRHFVQIYEGVPSAVAYQDTALPISCGQTMPAFSVHAKFLSLLEPHVAPGAAVLDLGAGTGYMAACLAQLAGPQGRVLALEKQQKLVQRAQASIKASIPALCGAVDVRVCNVMADPSELQGSACFDAIHVGASLTELPRSFVQLLRPGGRLVVPLGAMHGAAPQVIVTLDKRQDGTLMQQQHGALTTRIQPLTQAHDDNIWD